MMSKLSTHGRRRTPHHAWATDIGADDGTAAVEFAIIAPLFLTILIGIMVYGYYFTVMLATTQLASDSARAGLAGLTTSEQASIAQTRFNTNVAVYGTMLSGAVVNASTPAAGTFTVTVTPLPATYSRLTSLPLVHMPVPQPVTVTVSTGTP